MPSTKETGMRIEQFTSAVKAARDEANVLADILFDEGRIVVAIGMEDVLDYLDQSLEKLRDIS